MVAYQLYFRALARDGALVSVITVLRRTNVIVSFAIGSALFRGRLLGAKGLALLGVLLGLGLLLKG